MRSRTALAGRSASARNKRISRTRRQRGYHWEDTLVKRFNALDGWQAFRLGSPSVGLPDILAVGNADRSIYTIEAKSGTVNTLQVPTDQILRCLRWGRTFELYESQIVFAFKFLSKKRVGAGVYESRPLREHYKLWDARVPATDCVCTYDGDTYGLRDGERVPLDLDDCQMPFGTMRA